MSMVGRGLIALLLAVCIWQCLTIFASATITRSVALNLDNAVASGASARKLAATRLTTATRIDPGYAPAWHMLARVTTDPADRREIFTHITSIAPRDALAWAQVFALSLRNPELAELRANALTRAIRSGRYDPPTMLTLLDAGTGAWLYLDDSERNVILGVAARSLQTSASWLRNKTVSLLKQRGFLQAACRQLAAEFQVAQAPECQGDANKYAQTQRVYLLESLQGASEQLCTTLAYREFQDREGIAQACREHVKRCPQRAWNSL